jgi:hypothetical protein
VAQAVVVRALLAQDKSAEAEKERDRFATPAARSQNVEARLKFRIAAARARAAMPRNADAKKDKDLEAVLAEATQRGLSQHQFEARLVLGEMKMKSGGTEAGRAYLEALEKDAAAKGFLLIARKARAAQRIDRTAILQQLLSY